MYVPSCASILRALGIDPERANKYQDEVVSIKIETIHLLLKYIAMSADFDEAVYLRENPDVAAAYEDGRINSLHQHFVQAGFFEGRVASVSPVDEAWYAEHYADVGQAISAGGPSSAAAHFVLRGEFEWRAPNLDALPWVRAWAEVQLNESRSAL